MSKPSLSDRDQNDLQQLECVKNTFLFSKINTLPSHCPSPGQQEQFKYNPDLELRAQLNCIPGPVNTPYFHTLISNNLSLYSGPSQSPLRTSRQHVRSLPRHQIQALPGRQVCDGAHLGEAFQSQDKDVR